MPPIVTTQKQKRNPGKPSLSLWILVALLLGIGLYFFFFSNRQPTSENVDISLNPTSDTNSPVGNSKDKDLLASPSSSSVGTDAPQSATQSPPQTHIISPAGDKPLSAEEIAKEKAAAAKAKMIADNKKAEEILAKQSRPRHFDNDVENHLELVTDPELKGFAPGYFPQVDMSEKEILEILNRPVDIYEDDPEDVVAAKMRTAEMKEEAKAFIAEGGTLNQFLRDYYGEVAEANAERTDCEREMKRILREEGEEAALAYMNEVNPFLKEKGLKELNLGKRLLQIERKKREKATAQ